MVVVSKKQATNCWKHRGKDVPFVITSTDGGRIEKQTVYGGYPPDNVIGECIDSCYEDLYLLEEGESLAQAEQSYRLPMISSMTIEYQAEPYQTNNDSIMPNIISFFNELTATAEEKLLKKYNLEDPIGTPTELGLELLAKILYKENRDKVIDVAKKKELEEAKTKN